MPRARNIKPGFFENEDLAELQVEARLLFIGLWTLADREGRLEDRPKRIKMQLFPLDDIDADNLLQQLSDSGFIVRYGECTRQARCKHQAEYIQILTFEKHQSPHCKEKASTIPAPDKHGASTVQAEEGKLHAPPDSLNPDSLNPDSLKKEGAPNGASPPKQKRGCRIPEDFPDDDALIWATENFPMLDHNQEAEKFRDYWLSVAGQKGVKLDWMATWRGWIRRALEFQQERKPSGDKSDQAVESFVNG